MMHISYSDRSRIIICQRHRLHHMLISSMTVILKILAKTPLEQNINKEEIKSSFGKFNFSHFTHMNGNHKPHL